MNLAKFLRTAFIIEHLRATASEYNSNDEEEGAEYKAKRISNSQWCVCVCAVQKQSLADGLQNRCQACNFI